MKYVNTNNFGYVDVLSRLMQRFLKDDSDQDYVIAKVEADLTAQVLQITQRLPITNVEIAEETAKDTVLQKLVKQMRDGWPQLYKDLKDPDPQPY